MTNSYDTCGANPPPSSVSRPSRRLRLEHLEDRTLLDGGTASIVGHAFVDANVNGVLDSGEAGIANVSVMLMGNNVYQTAQTDSAGGYQFTGLAFGTYSIGVLTPIGMSASGMPGYSATLTAAQPSAEVDAGLVYVPPTLYAIPNQTNREGDTVSLQVSASAGGGSIHYAIAGQPAGLSINPLTGLITGTVAVGDASATPYAVVVTASNGSASSQETFSWTVVNGQGGTEIWNGPANGNWATAANWLSGIAPTANSNVIFDGAIDNADCIFNQAVAGLAAKSVTFQNDYYGTLHLQQSYGAWGIGKGGITQSSGYIEQETGQDINVGGDYNISGGGVDVVSALLADINIDPGEKMTVTGHETIGANQNLTNKATLSLDDANGVLTVKNGASINVDATSTLMLKNGTIDNIAMPGVTVGTITNAGFCRVGVFRTDAVIDALPIRNTGTVMVVGILEITGKDSDNHGYSQTGKDSITELAFKASLVSSSGDVYINGGNFWTLSSTFASILADVTFNAGTIDLNHGDNTATGTLYVTGNVTLAGTAKWLCKVDCSAGSTSADYIQSSKLLTLGGTWVGTAIKLPAGGKVPVGGSWLFVSDKPGVAIAGAFGDVTADFNDGSGKSWIGEPNKAGDVGYLKS